MKKIENFFEKVIVFYLKEVKMRFILYFNF